MKKSYTTHGFSSNKIEFYTCWEDIQVIQNALNINSDDVVLSISSAGCNILNFLLYDPKKIIAVDFNPYQNYLLELKIEAIRHLDYNEFLEFLGVKPSNRRVELYVRLKDKLNKEVQKFWDKNINTIKNGLIYFGEPNVKAVGYLLRFLKGQKAIEGFFKCQTIDEQTDYFYKNIYGAPWLIYLKIFYNKNFIRLNLCFRILFEFHYRKTKTTGIFRYIQKAAYPKNHIDHIISILINNPIKYNYFASLTLLNRFFNEDCYPPYLKKESYPTLKERINRIQIKTSSLEKILMELPDSSVTKFNLSNIFDFHNDKTFINLLEKTKRAAKNNARLFYSATRTDCNIPENISGILSEKELANKLLEKDRTMLYGHFEVGKITK